MTGICGVVSFRPDVAREYEPLDRCLDALSARGRAGRHVLRLGRAALGGLSSAFHSRPEADGRATLATRGVLVVEDARIDNREYLVDAFRLGAGEAAAASNRMLFGLAYERWGAACVDHLLGEYAVAIWDEGAQRLTLFRDHLGARPLYYCRIGDRLAFASEVKGLFCFPWVPRQLCTDRVMEFLGYQSTGLNAPLTFFQDVQRVLAGSLLEFSENACTTTSYWQPSMTREIRLGSDEAYVEAFGDLYHRAVRRRLPEGASVGICLSGGFDSSGIAISAASALRERGQVLKAFVSVAPTSYVGPSRDVRPYCDALALRIPNLELHYLTGEGADLNAGAELFEICEAPAHVLQNRLHLLFGEARWRGVTQMLAGYAGDQAVTPLGGGFLCDLFLQGRLSLAIRELRARSRTTGRSVLGIFLADVGRLLIPAPIWRGVVGARAGQAAWSVHAVCNPETLRHSSGFRRLRRHPASGFRALTSIRATSVRGLQFCMSGRGFDPCHNIAAHHHMGLGLPMLDRTLVEFALALPPEQHVRDGRRRHLIRRGFATELPTIILDRDERDDFIVPDMMARFVESFDAVSKEFDELKTSALVRHFIDVDRMGALLRSAGAPGATGRGSSTGVFLRGFAAARFIRWFEDGGAIPSGQ